MRRALWLAAVGLVVGGCEQAPRAAATGPGDVTRGRELVVEYGCQTCHRIPGVRGADAHVGPPLDRFSLRVYAGGKLNTPANLVEFLENPKAHDPENPMPVVGLSATEAWDVAAFLYTLR